MGHKYLNIKFFFQIGFHFNSEFSQKLLVFMPKNFGFYMNIRILIANFAIDLFLRLVRRMTLKKSATMLD